MPGSMRLGWVCGGLLMNGGWEVGQWGKGARLGLLSGSSTKHSHLACRNQE